AAARFITNFNQLDAHIRAHITLENDDKTFTATETLAVCQKVNVPMVLDIHHHQVNTGGDVLDLQLWEQIVRTWESEPLLAPKIHVSSPKSDKDQRGHADYVDVEPLLQFLRMVRPKTPQLDVMI